jgi:putative glycosyltransferase (TIGR04372 family)
MALTGRLRQFARQAIARFSRSRPRLLLTGLLAFILWESTKAKAHFALGLLKRALTGGASQRFRKISPRAIKKLAGKIDRVEQYLLLCRKNNNLAHLSRLLAALTSIGHLFAAAGNLELAEHSINKVSNFQSPHSLEGIATARNLAIWQFMRGHLERSKTSFKQVGLAHQYLQVISRISPNYRVLEKSWFAALGHVAMIDILLKKMKLGWCGNVSRFVVTEDVSNLAGKVILQEFIENGVEMAAPDSLPSYYNSHREPTDPEWNQLSPVVSVDGLKHAIEEPTDPEWNQLSPGEREGLFTGFWDYTFPDGEVSFFAHGAAKIQGEWEHRRLPPLLELSKPQQGGLGMLKEQLGVPKSAWYVCLHVRESGFYQKWNSVYQSARDADIDDYYPAMQAIVERGGWVIRMGDASMKPLRPMPGVVDYVSGNLKTEQADTLLAAGCRFMLGANSGFTILPATYGAPCVLTNWAPIALPNWYACDLMIPKMMRSKSSGQLLDFTAMFEEPIGVIQNMLDFPEDIELVENTPDEIQTVTTEMLDRLSGRPYTQADDKLQERYFRLAIKKGSYRGSRIGRDFLEKHSHLLPSG